MMIINEYKIKHTCNNEYDSSELTKINYNKFIN